MAALQDDMLDVMDVFEGKVAAALTQLNNRLRSTSDRKLLLKIFEAYCGNGKLKLVPSESTDMGKGLALTERFTTLEFLCDSRGSVAEIYLHTMGDAFEDASEVNFKTAEGKQACKLWHEFQAAYKAWVLVSDDPR